MSRRCGSGTALLFTAMVLAGCSLVESVIVFEPQKEASGPVRKAPAAVALASSPEKCAQSGLGDPVCSGTEAVSKAWSAKYDSGPVLKPIKKSPEKKADEAPQDSRFVKAVKSWFRTGMQLPSWVTAE